MLANDISFWSPCKAFIEVSGVDATSFLHRLSTQDVLNAPRAQAFANCFLDQKGKIIDVVHQISLAENKWLLTSSHDTPEKLKNWLERYCFAEQVNFKDYCVDEAADTLTESKRIARCTPKSPNEICEAYNPLELGLSHLIAWNKGCYIGQEVISRLDTYDKVSRQLMAVACKKEDFERLKESPEITSVLDKFIENQAVAMGIFKKAALTSESYLTTGNGTAVWVVSSAR